MNNFITAFKHCYIKNYFNFKGTTSRKDFWWFALSMRVVIIIGSIVCFLAGDYLQSSPSVDGFFGKMGMGFVVLFAIAYCLFILSLLIPMIAAPVRRLRDAGKSPYLYVWLYILPLVVLYISAILFMLHQKSFVYILFYIICYIIFLIALIILIVFLAQPSKPVMVTQEEPVSKDNLSL